MKIIKVLYGGYCKKTLYGKLLDFITNYTTHQIAHYYPKFYKVLYNKFLSKSNTYKILIRSRHIK